MPETPFIAVVPSLAIRLCTTNDTNGNPRRGWLLVDRNGEALRFVDEDYCGSQALRQVLRDYGILKVPLATSRTAELPGVSRHPHHPRRVPCLEKIRKVMN